MDRVRSLALGSILFAALGCADNDRTLLILHNQVPEEGCIIPASNSSNFIFHGTIDLTDPTGLGIPAVLDGYFFTPLLQNAAAATADQDPNLRVIILQGADVELTANNTQASHDLIDAMAADPQQYNKRKLRFSGSVSPNGGLTAVGFNAIDHDQLQFIRTSGRVAVGSPIEVIAKVEVYGTIDSGDIRSGTFEYPITVCLGCLIEDLGQCTSVTMDTSVSTGGICNPLQDGILSCCLNGATLECPAPVPTM